MFDLTGHVALVTGGNSGIGLAYARGLVKCGAKVVIWGRKAEKNAAALSELHDLGGKADAFICNVTDIDAVNATMAKSIDRFGQLDSCFANAGGQGNPGAFAESTAQGWDHAIALNLSSVVNTYRPFVQHVMERKAPGKLVVTSSIAARMGMPMGSGYSATKAAVAGLTRALAVELGRANIQVNAVLPGYIPTEMSLQAPDHFSKSMARRTASGVVGSPEDFEGVAVFLASRHSNYITGQEIVVDGGQSVFPF
jgi:NAD(P)-dependent dehydrogenase (short-subunit alcohol dehydrogenase family)